MRMAVAQQGPDFLVWVKNTLLFKAEERATQAEMFEAMAALRQRFCEAWVEGTVRVGANVRRPCVLAYAAAGCFVQVGGRPGALREGTGRQQGPHH